MKISVRKITIVAMIIALSVVGRVIFTFIPNVQPTTSIIIISGFFLGPIFGIIVAVLSAILSNMIMGMGLWTFGQILAWGLIGITSGMIGKYIHRIPFYLLVSYTVLCGFLYGIIISIPLYMFTGKMLAYYIAGLPFDVNHAVGNGIFFIILYPVLRKLFIKFSIYDEFRKK